jgi:hypothetical protein
MASWTHRGVCCPRSTGFTLSRSTRNSHLERCGACLTRLPALSRSSILFHSSKPRPSWANFSTSCRPNAPTDQVHRGCFQGIVQGNAPFIKTDLKAGMGHEVKSFQRSLTGNFRFRRPIAIATPLTRPVPDKAPSRRRVVWAAYWDGGYTTKTSPEPIRVLNCCS